MGTIADA
jgi:ribonuclease HI